MNAVCVILARAGSKGVPSKNSAPVAGRPCVEWTIDHARASRRVARVAVSTDCPVVARAARAAGCEVVGRPPELATDAARVDDAARHAVRVLLGPSPTSDRSTPPASARDNPASPPPPIVILYANVPVRPPDLTDRALALLLESGADSVQSYAPVGKFHPWWTARLDPSGLVRPWEGEILNHGVFRRQDLPPAYIPDGGTLALTRHALDLAIPDVPPGPHAFFGLKRMGITTREGDVIDIDSSTDLLVADAALRSAPAASR